MGPVLAPGRETHRGDVEEVEPRALRPCGPGVRVRGDLPLVGVGVLDEVDQTLRLAGEERKEGSDSFLCATHRYRVDSGDSSLQSRL